MNSLVGIGELVHDLGRWQIIDVRSPGEFNHGHIPGAINIPLFSDEERARVGTLYKQISPESAMKEGLNIAGGKMNYYLDAAKPLLTNGRGRLVIHCWRGGKRSEAIHWLYKFSGIPSGRLEGGYKSFRSSLHRFFSENEFDLRILGGHTGSGKTEILRELAAQGHQVVDLENLARHKGSAFGAIGERPQPSNEQFENDLYAAFLGMDLSKPIWLENESRNIGRVFIPEALWIRMRRSILYNIDVRREVRLGRAIQYYAGDGDRGALEQSFHKIRKRLGGLDYQNAIHALAENDLEKAASIALDYYDKTYHFQLQGWDTASVRNVTGCDSVKEAALKLIEIDIKYCKSAINA